MDFDRFIDSSIWESTPWNDITSRFAPNKKQQIIDQIKADVLAWLADDKADSVLQFNFKPTEMVLFSRSEIYIKTSANSWDVWRIATASGWPEIISRRVKEVGTNSMLEDFRMPNEVRPQSYSEFSKPEEIVWNLV